MQSLPRIIQETVNAHKRLKIAKHKGQKPALVVLPLICQLMQDEAILKEPPNHRFSYYEGIPVMFSNEPEEHNGFVVMKCDLTQEQRNYLKRFPNEKSLLRNLNP
jgi:hypothetical protein